MLTPGGERTWKSACLQRFAIDDYLVVTENLAMKALNVRCVPGAQHILRHGGLELTVTPEHNERVQLAFVLDSQKLRDGSDVPEVLMQRILHAELLSVPNDSPVPSFLVSKDPTVDVLRLDDEDAVLDTITWSIWVVPPTVRKVTSLSGK